MPAACTSPALAQACLASMPGRPGEPIPDGGPRMRGLPDRRRGHHRVHRRLRRAVHRGLRRLGLRHPPRPDRHRPGVLLGAAGPDRGRPDPGLRAHPWRRPGLLGARPGDLRRVHHVRFPAAADQPGRRLGAVPGRLDLPGRAERLPVLPGHLLRPAGSGAVMSGIDDILPAMRACGPARRRSTWTCTSTPSCPTLSTAPPGGSPSSWGFGFTDRDTYLAAEKDGHLEDLPTNHSPKFLPPLRPTLQTGTEALITAALAWLAP